MDSPWPIPTATLTVLTHRFFFEMISEFQDGMPKPVLAFAMARHRDWHSLSVRHRQQRLRRLGVEAMASDDGSVRLLQLLSRVRFVDTASPIVYSIPLPAIHAVTSHRPEMLQWIFDHDSDPYARPHDLWDAAFTQFNGDFAVLNVLKTSAPLRDYDTTGLAADVVHSLLDMRLLQWVCENLNGFTLPLTRLMRAAATAGSLATVEFLHDTFPTHTYPSDIYYCAWRAGAFEVLEFLIKHRPEPCPERLIEEVVESQCLSVLEMIHKSQRIQVLPRMLELADTLGYLEIRSFLQYHAACTDPAAC